MSVAITIAWFSGTVGSTRLLSSKAFTIRVKPWIGNASIAMMKDVQAIFRATPREKQVMMFSDTLNKDVRSIYRKFTQHPVELYDQH